MTGLILLITLVGSNGVSAALLQPKIQSAAGIVVDAQTGQVILSKNSQERLPIASISKLIVIYMVQQKIQAGKLSSSQEVHISNGLAQFSQNHTVANVAMNTTQSYTVLQLEEAALLPSSNAAAMALAQLVSGSQQQYYKEATELLAAWGIRHVQLYSASGLRSGEADLTNLRSAPQTADGLENTLSARETALIAQKLVNNYPNILAITKLSQAQFPNLQGEDRPIQNTDKLLGRTNYAIEGLKTGTSANNGVNFVGYARVNGRQVITVTLNAPQDANFTDTLAMLDTVANETKVTDLTMHTAVKIDNAKVAAGEVALVTKPIAVYSLKTAAPLKLISKLTMVTKQTKAPIAKNQEIANRRLVLADSAQNDYLQSLPVLKYQAKSKINQTNFLVTWYRKITK
ncbi:D-alanyl-D-alanine carboxypeptidase [Weissella oryzae SG25]|uniref:D-alanyl-D-alanine carboxypeptidase n=1 Tax=Weissella oryzae (strain DSM 25784 / JCM 18191 / LMG 30913 / SG25) TaxID=1329250 RepID=A0A069CT09_WEIOS|nr:D-alanyl-D-alanine carboxypeptidase [Weissella oryzae SG25]